jgi:hypothetical protein
MVLEKTVHKTRKIGLSGFFWSAAGSHAKREDLAVDSFGVDCAEHA